MKPILANGGGGMKGYIPCAVLAEIERRSGKRITDLFSLLAGTSIGAITSLSLAVGNTAEETLGFFTGEGPKIFNSHWWTPAAMLARGYRYDPAPLEQALQKRLGNKKLIDSTIPVIITSADRNTLSDVFFKSTDTDTQQILMWQAARASSAAQTYFPPFALKGWSLVDGGNAANNPAMCALAQATSLWGWHEDFKVLSLSCGDPSYSKQPNNPGIITILKEAIGIMLGSSDHLPDYQCKQMLDEHYFSIDPGTVDVALDDASPEGLAMLNQIAIKTISDNSKLIDSFCGD